MGIGFQGIGVHNMDNVRVLTTPKGSCFLFAIQVSRGSAHA